MDPTALSKALKNMEDAGRVRDGTPGASPSRKRQRVYGDRSVESYSPYFPKRSLDFAKGGTMVVVSRFAKWSINKRIKWLEMTREANSLRIQIHPKSRGARSASKLQLVTR